MTDRVPAVVEERIVRVERAREVGATNLFRLVMLLDRKPWRDDGTDQQRAVAVFLEYLTSPLDDVDKQRVAQVGNQDSHGLGARIRQGPGRQVHPVAEFVRGLLDAAPLLLAHHRLISHHERDQRFRHPGPRCDISDRRSAAVMIAASGHLLSPLASLRVFGPFRVNRLLDRSTMAATSDGVKTSFGAHLAGGIDGLSRSKSSCHQAC